MPKKSALSEEKIRLSNSTPEKHNHLSTEEREKPKKKKKKKGKPKKPGDSNGTKAKEGEFQKVETSQ